MIHPSVRGDVISVGAVGDEDVVVSIITAVVSIVVVSWVAVIVSVVVAPASAPAPPPGGRYRPSPHGPGAT